MWVTTYSLHKAHDGFLKIHPAAYNFWDHRSINLKLAAGAIGDLHWMPGHCCLHLFPTTPSLLSAFVLATPPFSKKMVVENHNRPRIHDPD
jgi:hypothetical protein